MTTLTLVRDAQHQTPTSPSVKPYPPGQRFALAALASALTGATSPLGVIDLACGALDADPEDLRTALRALTATLDDVLASPAARPEVVGPGTWPFGPGEDHACTLGELVSGANGHLYAPCCGLDLT